MFVMPVAAKGICPHPGCGKATARGRCPEHAAQLARELEARRESSTRRGYGRRWRAARAAFLREHPLCRACEEKGLIVASTEVDHVVPHKGDRVLFWDRSNWQALCKTCHAAKTAREDGRWS